MSTRESVLAAIATILGAAGTVTALVSNRIYRTRREQIGALPALQIEQDGADSQEIVLGKSDTTLNVVLTAYAAGDTPDSAPDAALAAAHAALMADLTLGLGADVQLQPNYTLDAPQVDSFDYVALAHRYQVFIRTALNAF